MAEVPWYLVLDDIGRRAEALKRKKTNADSSYCADFCPSTERPRCCVHFEEQETNNNENQA